MRHTTEVGEVIKVLEKRKWIVIIASILFMILGIIYSFFIATPVYRADTTLIVSGSERSKSDIDISTVSVNQMIAVTYGEIVKSRAVLEPVIAELKLDTNYEDFLEHVSAGAVGSTEILRISVKDESKQDAVLIADKITEVFIKEASRILKVDNTEVIDYAAATEHKVNKSALIIIIIATIAGSVMGMMLALVVDYQDNRLKTEEDIEKYLDLPVIGSIPNFKSIKKD